MENYTQRELDAATAAVRGAERRYRIVHEAAYSGWLYTSEEARTAVREKYGWDPASAWADVLSARAVVARIMAAHPPGRPPVYTREVA